MSYVSVLFPAIKTRATSYDKIVNVCSKRLGFKKDDIELFRLVPIMADDQLSKHESEGAETEIAVRVHNSSISMSEVEKIIQQRDKNKEQLQKTNEALKTYLKELQKMRKYFMDIVNETSTAEGDKAMAAKAMRYKKLEEDNNRLRNLLKTQLENSENLRLETQHTVETLREEFNVLVKNKEKENKFEGRPQEGTTKFKRNEEIEEDNEDEENAREEAPEAEEAPREIRKDNNSMNIKKLIPKLKL